MYFYCIEMVNYCLVIGRLNCWDCQSMSWHWIPAQQDSLTRLKKALDLLATIKYHHRICSNCMQKVPLSSTQHHMTRQEICNAVAHDHTYCMSSVDRIPNCLTPTPHNGDLPVSLATAYPLETVNINNGLQWFGIEHVTNDEQAVQFYTSFPSYSHFIVCFYFLGEAVNHLTYSRTAESKTTSCNRGTTQRILSPKNEFFLTLCQLRCDLMEQDLAYRFNISQATVSCICIA